MTNGKCYLFLQFLGTPPSSHWYLLAMNPIILHDDVRYCPANAVTDLSYRWQWAKLKHPPYSPVMSPCNYDTFRKMEEPVWGNHYITHDIGQSLRAINRDASTDGVRCLYVRQKVPRLYWRNVSGFSLINCSIIVTTFIQLTYIW